MKLILKDSDLATVVDVEIAQNGLTVAGVVERLFRPALLAMGYHPESINRQIGEVDEDGLVDGLNGAEW